MGGWEQEAGLHFYHQGVRITTVIPATAIRTVCTSEHGEQPQLGDVFPQQLLQAPAAAPQPPQPLQLQPDVKDFLGQAIEEAVEAPDVVDHDAIRAACAAAIALLPVIA